MWSMKGLVRLHVLLFHLQSSSPHLKDYLERPHCNQKSMDQNLCSTVVEGSLQESANQIIHYQGTEISEKEFEKAHKNK